MKGWVGDNGETVQGKQRKVSGGIFFWWEICPQDMFWETLGFWSPWRLDTKQQPDDLVSQYTTRPKSEGKGDIRGTEQLGKQDMQVLQKFSANVRDLNIALRCTK